MSDKKEDKQAPKKPEDVPLGSGLASAARERLLERRAKIDALLAEAESGERRRRQSTDGAN